MACSGQQQHGGENEWCVECVSGQQQHGGENEWRVGHVSGVVDGQNFKESVCTALERSLLH